jgi:hypothetical protein
MNTTPDEIADLLSSQARVCVRLAAKRNGDAWQLAVLEIITGQPPTDWHAHVWHYDTAVLIAARPAGRAVSRWLTGKRVRMASLTMPLDLDTVAHRERRDSNSHGTFQTLAWPTHNWTLHLTDQPTQVTQEELVAAGMPAFINFDQAAAVHFQPPRLLNRNFSGREAIVRHQDERARFEHVLLRPTELTATVSGSNLNGVTATLGGYDGPHQTLTARTRRVRLPIPGGLPPGAWVALHRDQELIDRRILDPTWGPTGIDVELEPTTRVEVWINGGERDTVEFKRELPHETDRVMRTVAAFANGAGGVLLFGVEDDGQIIGFAPKRARTAVDHLTNLIRDKIRPLPNFRGDVIQTDGRPIVALTVEAGQHPPYGVGSDSRALRYYIRRAASTFPASPDDLRELIRPDPQAPLMYPPRKR